VANPEEFKKLQQMKWVEGRAAAAEWRWIAIQWRIATPSSKKTSFFASYFEEWARTTYVLPEDTSCTRVVRKVQTAELSGSYSDKCSCCIPLQLFAERVHAHKWEIWALFPSGIEKSSFNFTSTKSRYTNCQPRKKK